jgi:hypothetical protein
MYAGENRPVREGELKQKSNAAFRTIFIISKCFQTSKLEILYLFFSLTGHPRLRVRGRGGSQFGRLKKKPSTLSTLVYYKVQYTIHLLSWPAILNSWNFLSSSGSHFKMLPQNTLSQ